MTKVTHESIELLGRFKITNTSRANAKLARVGGHAVNADARLEFWRQLRGRQRLYYKGQSFLVPFPPRLYAFICRGNSGVGYSSWSPRVFVVDDDFLAQDPRTKDEWQALALELNTLGTHNLRAEGTFCYGSMRRWPASCRAKLTVKLSEKRVVDFVDKFWRAGFSDEIPAHPIHFAQPYRPARPGAHGHYRRWEDEEDNISVGQFPRLGLSHNLSDIFSLPANFKIKRMAL